MATERREYIKTIKNSLEKFNEESQLIFEQLQNLKSDDITLQILITEIQKIRENTVSEKHYNKLTNILNQIQEGEIKESDLNKSVDEISEGFMKGTNTLLEGIGSKIGEMAEQNELIVSGINKVGGFFGEIFSPFQELFNLITGTFSILQGVFGYMTKIPTLLMGLMSVIRKDPTPDKLDKLIDLEESKIKKEDREIKDDSSIWSELLLIAGQITGGIMAGVSGFVTAVQKDIVKMYKPFMNVFKNGILDPVRNWFKKENWITNMLNRIKNIKGITRIEGLISRFSGIVDRIRNMFTSVIERLGKVRSLVDDLIKQSGKFGKIIGGISKALGRLVWPLLIAYEVIRGMIKGETIRDKILEASAGILSIATQIPEWIINGLLWAFGSEFRVDFGREAIIEAINDISDWLYKNVTEPITNFLKNFDLKESFNKLVNKIEITISDSFGSILKKYNNLKNMLMGFWNSLIKMNFLDSDLFSTITNWMEWTFDQIKKPFMWVKEKLQETEQWLINHTLFDKQTIDSLKQSMSSMFNWIIVPFKNVLTNLNDVQNWLITTVFADPTQTWESIKSVMSDVFDWITIPFKSVLEKLQNFWNWLTTTVFADPTQAWKDIKSVMSDMFNWITAPFTNVLTNLNTVRNWLTTTVFTDPTQAWENIKSVMSNVFDWITIPFKSVLGKLQNFWNWLTTTVFADPTQAWENIKSVMSDVFNWIAVPFKNVLTNLNNVQNWLITTVFVDPTQTWENIKSVMSNVFNWITTPFTNVLTNLNTVRNWLTTTVFTDPSQTWEGIKSTMSNVFDWITIPFTWVKDKLKIFENWLINHTLFDKQTIDSLKQSMSDVFGQVTAPFIFVKNLLSDMWNWLTATTFSDPSQAWEDIKNKLYGIFDYLTELFQPIKFAALTFYGLLTGDFGTMSTNVKKMLNSLQNVMSNIFNNIKNFLMNNTPIGPLVRGFNNLYNFLTEDNKEETILESLINDLKELPGQITNWFYSIIPNWKDDIEPRLKKIVPDWAEPWIFGKKLDIGKMQDTPKMSGKELMRTLIKGDAVDRKVGFRGMPDEFSLKKPALESMSSTQANKLLNTDYKFTKETRDSLVELTKKATKKKSIYTHDVTLENIMGNIKDILKGDVSYSDSDTTFIIENNKSRNIDSINTSISRNKIEEKNKERAIREKEINSNRNFLESINNKVSNNINNDLNNNVKNVNEPNKDERERIFPSEHIPDEIENLSLFLFTKNWGIVS